MEPVVYIFASQTRGTLYIGVTSDLPRRVYQHREGAIPGFTADHGVKRLVYIEPCPDMASAIAQEKQLKAWRPEWKIALIEQANPTWRDLALDLGLGSLNSKQPLATAWLLNQVQDDRRDKAQYLTVGDMTGYLNMRIAIALFLATASSPVSAGAVFGVNQGQPLSSLKIINHPRPNVYRVAPPTPNAEFESYLVVATPQTGVCKISAVGIDHKNDRYGSGVKAAFTKFKDLLQNKYGLSKDFDFIRSGALWDGDNEYVMSIKQNERSVSSFWDEDEGSNLSDDLSSIFLGISAISADSAYLTIGYEFKNFYKCKSLMDKASSDGL